MSDWENAAARLEVGAVSLLSLWGDEGRAHLAILDNGAIANLETSARYPALGAIHPPAIRLERAARDLHRLVPEGMPDDRPWLDHGPEYRFLPVIGANLHQVPVGPVHAGIIEPGHFRFTCDGETIVRVEERLGYVHRGVEGLMAGAAPGDAARLAGRISGDSTVAYAWAFAAACEQASGTSPPPRALFLRVIMAELERLANHLGDIGAICNDVSFALMHAHCAILRERVLRTAAACFGHRLMMDQVLPGGVSTDLTPEGAKRLRGLIAEIAARFPPLVTLYDLSTSVQDRTVSTGFLRPELARQFAAGGFVGRASGRDFDARRTPGYAPYDALEFSVPVRQEGDVNARVWIRIEEISQSLALLRQCLDRLPLGEIRVPLGNAEGAAMALIEGFRGDIFLWLRLAQGRIAACHARDPSWFQWPLLEAAIEGNIIADFPVCNKSFNCSYAGVDL